MMYISVTFAIKEGNILLHQLNLSLVCTITQLCNSKNMVIMRIEEFFFLPEMLVSKSEDFYLLRRCGSAVTY